ncbi:mitogen-activated protein kinase kinase kinase 1-like, partial [Trifolium medium]|nr:mitogen-activated protein kinase kinase kinase 1-like [Trifolium medium]
MKFRSSSDILPSLKIEEIALKYFDYDAGSSSSSSLDDSSGSLYTRSMELYDRTSFRIEEIEGELDRICQSLGLSGPEDFAIPAAAWEAM